MPTSTGNSGGEATALAVIPTVSRSITATKPVNGTRQHGTSTRGGGGSVPPTVGQIYPRNTK